jgi:hypothetical protein
MNDKDGDSASAPGGVGGTRYITLCPVFSEDQHPRDARSRGRRKNNSRKKSSVETTVLPSDSLWPITEIVNGTTHRDDRLISVSQGEDNRHSDGPLVSGRDILSSERSVEFARHREDSLSHSIDPIYGRWPHTKIA